MLDFRQRESNEEEKRNVLELLENENNDYQDVMRKITTIYLQQ